MPALEFLESRVVPATFFVITLGDSGAGSGDSGDLRYCLNQASTNEEADTVVFSAPGTIALSSALPAITDFITLDGLGPSANIITRAFGAGNFRLFTVQSGASLTVQEMTLAAGRDTRGGAILNAGSLSVQNVSFVGNSITGNNDFDGGGAIYNTGTLNVVSSRFSANSSARDGGAIVNFVNSTAAISSSTFVGNTGAIGGAIWNGGSLFITDTTLEDNEASIGGAIFAYADTLTVTASTFTGNTATSDGGAILTYNLAGDPVPVTYLENVTLSGNSAGGNGGGIYHASPGYLIVNNATVAYNSAGGSGGGLFASGDAPVLGNTLVALNLAAGTASDIAGLVDTTFSRNNLIGLGGSGGLVQGTNGNLVGVADPGLAPLNGYISTTHTHLLLPGSPAIDAGTFALEVFVDQRGRSREQDGQPDIGAFEAGNYQLDPEGFFLYVEAGVLTDSFAVRFSENGFTLSGVPVVFTIDPGFTDLRFVGGGLTATVFTDASGDAVPPRVFGTVSDYAYVNAMTGNLQTSYIAYIAPGAVADYLIEGPTSVKLGEVFDLIVTPVDAFGNPYPFGLGTLDFSSSDAFAVLPGPYTFQEGGEGQGGGESFRGGSYLISGFALNSSGTQTITVTDDSPTSHSAIYALSVENAPPTDLSVSFPAVVAPRNTFTLTGTFADLGGSQQTHLVFIEWGDGTTSDVLLAPGVTSFSVEHAYGFDLVGDVVLPIRVTVFDENEASDEISADILVRNAPPVLAFDHEAGFTNIGSVFTRDIVVQDADTDGTVRVTVNYGDGTIEVVEIAPGLFTLTHVYRDDASFFVTLTAEDGLGGVAVDSFRVDVLLAGVNIKDRVPTVGPGEQQTVTVPGVTATLIRSADSTGQAALIVAVVPSIIADSLDGRATGATTTLTAYDVRAIGIGPNDVAIVTFAYFNDDNDLPTITYFDRVTRTQKAVASSQLIIDPVAHTITIIFNSTSTPRLQDLGGTVFTISVPIALPATQVNTSLILTAPAFQSGFEVSATRISDSVVTTGNMVFAAASESSAGTASGGGGGEASEEGEAAGGRSAPERVVLQELPPAPDSVYSLPQVTIAPSRLEPSNKPIPETPARQDEPQPEQPEEETRPEEANETEEPAAAQAENEGQPLFLMAALGAALAGGSQQAGSPKRSVRRPAWR